MTQKIHFDATFFRGRVALMAVLRAMGIGAGDEVIVQAYTCVAVPEGILATGAKPKFVDIEENSVTMSAAALEAAITPSTKAVIIQHTFGYSADMNALMAIAQKHGLHVVEDCAHTYWSEYEGKRLGTFGDAAIYSLEWGKPLIVGVGGGLAINNNELKDKVLDIRSKMQTPSTGRNLRLQAQYYAFSALYTPSTYWRIRQIYQSVSNLGVAEKSFNDLQLGRSGDFELGLSPSAEKRLKRILPDFQPDWDHNQSLVQAYQAAFADAGDWKEVSGNKDAKDYLQRLPFWVENKQAALDAAKEAGFELSDWFESAVDPLTEDTFEQVNYQTGSCPNAELAAQHIVSLPCLPNTRLKPAQKGAVRILEKYTQQMAQG